MIHKLYALATDMRRPVSMDMHLLKEECEKYLAIVKGLEQATGIRTGLHPEWPKLYFMFESAEARKAAWWYLRKEIEHLEIINRLALLDEETYQKSFGKN